MDEKTPLTSSGPYGGSYPGGSQGPYGQGGAAAPYPPQGAGPQGGYPQPGDPPQPGGYPQPGGPPQPGGYPQPGGPPPPAGAVPPMKEGGAGDGSEPSAPPPETMDQPPGYENLGFEGSALPPPTYDEATAGPPPERKDVQNVAAITEDQARDAIIQFSSEHCCYGAKPAKEMKFRDFKSTSAFHYTLETFGESRSTKWTSEPYRGEGVNVTGPPPGPWDIQAQPAQMFVNSKLIVEVPNTANVKPCYRCNAVGYKTCTWCYGTGRRRCNSCNGTGRQTHYEQGRQETRSCPFCMGGYSSCSSCGGMGRNICNKCQARGSLRWFIQLTIKWTNHMEDHIVERTALPDELIRSVSGEVAFEETNARVWPVNHFPEQQINAASNNLVSKHGAQFPTERILMQRHRVRIIPVTEVEYKYNDEKDSFFVYGFEHRVYCPNYPAKCCCGCSIL